MSESTIFPSRFRAFVQEHTLLRAGDRVVAAVSGGVDSVVLLHLLAGDRMRLQLDLVVAHFNHQLRGPEADADEQFVSALAGKLGLDFRAGRGDVRSRARDRRTGIEETARELRYGFLQEVCRETGAGRIATGHNADDNAETMLLHLFRGAGVRGLAGIPIQRNDGLIIRPLLFATRNEIAAYAVEQGITFREDSTNADDDRARNVIRHHILPVARSRVQPGVVRTLLRTAEVFRELDSYLAQIARTGLDQVIIRRTDEEVHLSLPILLSFPRAIRQYLIMHVAETTTGLRLRSDRVNAVLAMTGQQPGRRISLGCGWEVIRERDTLCLLATRSTGTFTVQVLPGRAYTVGEARFSFTLGQRREPEPRSGGDEELVDAELAGTQPLVLRSWQPGDRFTPLGMTGTKKISDFLVDAGIPLREKHRHPVLVTSGGEIIWLCGLRIDERFKITARTQQTLRLRFQRQTEGLHGESPQR
jgi:tRNA(Ile)-lysidine synthase